jgi:hypothetical protein
MPGCRPGGISIDADAQQCNPNMLVLGDFYFFLEKEAWITIVLPFIF